MDLPSNVTRRLRVIVTQDDGSQAHFMGDGKTLLLKALVASGSDALDAAIDAMADGGVAVKLSARKQTEPNIILTLSDTSGVFKSVEINVNIVMAGGGPVPVSGGTLGLDLSAPEDTPQPVPAADTPATVPAARAAQSSGEI